VFQSVIELNSSLDSRSELQDEEEEDEERCWEDEQLRREKGSERGQRILLQIDRVRLEPEALSKHGDFRTGFVATGYCTTHACWQWSWGFGRGSQYGGSFNCTSGCISSANFPRKCTQITGITHARNTPPHTHNHNLCHMSFLLPNHISTRFSCKTGICCGWEVRWSRLQMHCVTEMDHFKV